MANSDKEIKKIVKQVKEQKIAVINAYNKQVRESMENLKLIAKLQKELDYTKLPQRVRSALLPLDYVLEIDTKLTWDGRQFIVRIPKEIIEGYKVTKDNHIRFRFVKSSPLKSEKQEKPKLEISVI